MADGTERAEVEFGTIVVVGGGCYGSYYVRQLLRAGDAGKARWARLVVVDRDPACAVAVSAEWSGHAEVVVAEWSAYFAEFLGRAAEHPGMHAADAIVPSPLMPHLLFDWVHARAVARWPGAGVVAAMPGEVAGVPWQKAGGDGTRYVSFATWICPINCIEPAKCPHTRTERDWSLHRTLAPDADRSVVFRVTHRVFGVGMTDVADVLAADRLVAERLPLVPSILVATASHCHGAAAELRMGGTVSPAPAFGEI